jgi:hypothetical protein
MQRAPIIKLKTNIPLTGQIKYADIVDGQYGPQLRLKGMWDAYDGSPAAETIVFVHDQLLQELISKNLVKQGRDDKSYMAAGHSRVKITRSGEGRSVRTTIEPLNGATPAPAAGGQSRSGGVGAPAAPPQHGQEPAGVTFSRVVKTYSRCVEEAKKVWGDTGTPEVIQAGAACLFIELNKRGVLAAVDVAKAPAEPIATEAHLSELYDLGGRLGWTQEKTQADIMEVNKINTMVGLTVAQAAWAKQRLTFLAAQQQLPNNNTFE